MLSIAFSHHSLLNAQRAAAEGDQISRATAFVQYLVDGKFADAAAALGAALLKALPPDKLQQAWQSTLASCGAFKSLGQPRIAAVIVGNRPDGARLRIEPHLEELVAQHVLLGQGRRFFWPPPHWWPC